MTWLRNSDSECHVEVGSTGYDRRRDNLKQFGGVTRLGCIGSGFKATTASQQYAQNTDRSATTWRRRVSVTAAGSVQKLDKAPKEECKTNHRKNSQGAEYVNIVAPVWLFLQ